MGSATERMRHKRANMPKTEPGQQAGPPVTWNPSDARANGGQGTRPKTATEVPVSTVPARRRKGN